ncbi:alkaline phosphatase D family protein [bacterium]|nr:alkaline phosphatase D family protein [bacterium]
MSFRAHLPIEVLPPPGTGATLPRREFLRLLSAALGGIAALSVLPARRAFAGAVPAPIFPDGIKSGDPKPGSGVIWTRVAPLRDGPATVLWSVAEDAAMQQVVAGGMVSADPARGHTVTVPVRRLRPDRWYHYQFEHEGVASPVGRLRTAPAVGTRPDRLRYAFASCQQRNDSYYVAHRAIAAEGVDFLLHLGDYVYVSDGGTLTLDDYRGVYRRFHSNPLLQELQAAVPLVAVWDDGEFYNGVDATGPAERLAAARTAWFEHMPVRRPRNDRVFRTVRWGRLAELHVLDTRQYRDPEVPANTRFGDIIDAQDTALPPGEQMFAPGRTTLGARQKRWLKRNLTRRRATWQLIGSSYDMAPWKLVDRDTPELRAMDPMLQRNGGIYVSNEAWDDYQAERRELMEHIDRHSVANVVVTSGHTHFYKASEIMPDFDDPTSPITAVEFVTGSLTADPDPRTIAPEALLHVAEAIMLGANAPYLKQVDLLHQGYGLVDITPEETIVDFRVLDTFDPDATASTFARFRVVTGRPGIEQVL